MEIHLEGNDLDDFVEPLARFLAKLMEENKCPECDSPDLLVEGRCTTCLNCGWSKCDI